MFGEIILTQEQYEKYYRERFIYGRELSQIFDIMKKDSYRILVLGAAGSGKTTLLNILSNWSARKQPLEIIKGHEILDNFLLSEITDVPILIDGLDEMESPYKLLHHISKCNKVICASRPISSLSLSESENPIFTHIISLNPSNDQIKQLIKMLFRDEYFLHDVEKFIEQHDTELAPRTILSVILNDILKDDIRKPHHSRAIRFLAEYNNVYYQINKGIDFSSSIIHTPKRIIVPSKEIIKDISFVSNSLLNKAKENPQIMYDFSPREFERMVCELLDKQGYKVNLTKQTRDGGKDIIVVQKSLLGEFCIYVECKKYDVTRPISVSLVRELYGTVMVDNATAGMIITTSYFTKDAKEYTEKIKHRMTLKDFTDLVQELNTITIQ